MSSSPENQSKDSKTKTISSPQDEVESAKILFQEGLVDEAKKTLFRVLSSVQNFSPAQKLLNEIQAKELEEIFKSSDGNAMKSGTPQASIDRRAKARTPTLETVLAELEEDLGFSIEDKLQSPTSGVFSPLFGMSDRQRLDIAVGYFEMQCYEDALRELRLVPATISVRMLIAKCLAAQGKLEESKLTLSSMLHSEELELFEKTALFYEYASIAYATGDIALARSYFEKILIMDPNYKDVKQLLANLNGN